jgi:hypothetical protein
MGFLLHDDRAPGYTIAVIDVAHIQSHEVTTSQLATQGEVEQREFSQSSGLVQPNPD